MDKVANAQAYIGGLTVALLQHKFREEFRDVYPVHVMADLAVAVGPMQSFLGFLNSEGHLTLNLKEDM